MNAKIQNSDTEYSHYDKFSLPSQNIVIGNSTLKWFNLAKEDEPVPVEIQTLARNFLHNENNTGNVQKLGDLGFVILHRCGADFYFLLASSWKNENELWESVYAKQNNGQSDFAVFQMEGVHRATFCVWELEIVWHEKQAWRQYLLSQRDEAATVEYLNDCYRGIA